MKRVKSVLTDLDEISVFQHFKSADVDAKARTIKGWASTSDKDRVDDVIVPDALKGAAKDLTKRGSKTVFYNHDTDIPIGMVVKSEYKTKGAGGAGIFVEIKISKASDVDDYWTKIKEGVLNSFSIRLRPKKVEVIRDEETGRILEYRILKMNLLEVSVVGIPCNEECSIEEVLEKSFSKRSDKMNKKQNGSTMADVAKEVVQTELAPITSALSEIQKSIAALAVKPAEPVKTVVAEPVKTVEAPKDEVPAWAKALQQEIQSLKSAPAKEEPKRKSAPVEDDEQEDNDDDCKSESNGADNAEFLKTVINTLDNPAKYAKLNEEEKKLYKSVYFSALLAQQTSKE